MLLIWLSSSTCVVDVSAHMCHICWWRPIYWFIWKFLHLFIHWCVPVPLIVLPIVSEWKHQVSQTSWEACDPAACNWENADWIMMHLCIRTFVIVFVYLYFCILPVELQTRFSDLAAIIERTETTAVCIVFSVPQCPILSHSVPQCPTVSHSVPYCPIGVPCVPQCPIGMPCVIAISPLNIYIMYNCICIVYVVYVYISPTLNIWLQSFQKSALTS